MATMMRHPSSSLNTQDPGGPKSASVLEFICLFTHDLKRKQKRWQDGRVKYHTFNRRVMAYDDRGGYVGDMHWRRDYDFDEGEEVQLERGGVIVQVSECIGRHEQDLTELLDKRAKEKEQRHVPQPPRSSPRPASRPAAPARVQQPDHSHTRHRPLHQLLGTPTGHHGRAALPLESPFEQRQGAASAGDADSRPSKRRRPNSSPPPSKSGYAQSLFGATLFLSATPVASAAPRSGPREVLEEEPSSSASEDTPAPQGKQRDTPPVVDNMVRDAAGQARKKRQVEAASNASPDPKPRQLQSRNRESGSPRRVTPAATRSSPVPVESDLDGSRPVTVNSPPVRNRRLKIQGNAPGKRHPTKVEAENEEARPDQRSRDSSSTNQKAQKGRATKLQQLSGGPSHQEPTIESGDVRLGGSPLRVTSSRDHMPHERPQPQAVLRKKPANLPVEPRTELRIKSRRKRGLLMTAETRLNSKPGPRPSEPPLPDPISMETEQVLNRVHAESPAKPSAVTRPDTVQVPQVLQDECAADSPGGLPAELLAYVPSNRSRPGHLAQPSLGPRCEASSRRGVNFSKVNGSIEAARLRKRGVIKTVNGMSGQEPAPGAESLDGATRDQQMMTLQRPSSPQGVETDKLGETGLGEETDGEQGQRSLQSNSPDGVAAMLPTRNQGPLRRTVSAMQAAESTSEPQEAQTSQTRSTGLIRQNPAGVCPDERAAAAGKAQAAAGPETAARIQSPRVLANPASRGRKAAKKSDAAGQTPQSLPELATPLAEGASIALAKKKEERRVASRTMSLPGFSSANGGPWSKEAYDLLGSGRPQ